MKRPFLLCIMVFVSMGLFALSQERALASPPLYHVFNLGTLGGTTSDGYALNLSGIVTGYSTIAGSNYTNAFTYDTTMHDLGTLGGTDSMGTGINASGVVVGNADVLNGGFHAFRYDTSMHDLGTLGGTLSHANAINVNGVVTGDSFVSGNTAFHVMLYDTSMHDLGTLGGTIASGTAINSSATVVGYSDLAGNNVTHAFMYNTFMHDLGTLPGGTNSFATAINDNGTAAGYSDTSGTSSEHAFRYDFTMHDLGTLGGLTSAGNAINNSGVVVGQSATSTDAEHAFYDDTKMYDLNSYLDSSGIGWTLEQANGINNAGDITGEGLIGGQTHAFLLIPASTLTATPEPGSVALLVAIAAVGSLTAFRHARRKRLGTRKGSLVSFSAVVWLESVCCAIVAHNTAIGHTPGK